jgi:transketolase
VRSHIGYGSPHKQDSFEAHGSPLGIEEVRLTKQSLDWPTEPPFLIPELVLAHFREALVRGVQDEAVWNNLMEVYAQAHPALAEELQKSLRGELTSGWDADIPVFPADALGIATRIASGRVMNAIAPRLPMLTGGSADLDPSTFTELVGFGHFNPPTDKNDDTQGLDGAGWSHAGRNLHFGVREHAMGAIINGLAAHGAIIPFGSTFLTFSDYMRPPIRLAALMGLHIVLVFTHDSIALGEDGPTHQPVEQLAALRSIPDLTVIRPGDANETAVAWRVAIEVRDNPVMLVLSRQVLPTLDRSRYAPADGLRRGAYILFEEPQTQTQLILIASGSEISLIVAAQHSLQEQNIAVRLVSMASWELFEAQSLEYRNSVLPPSIPARLAVEAGAVQGWHRYVGDWGDVLCVDRFGASAPGKIVMNEYGFSVENVCKRALALLERMPEQ